MNTLNCISNQVLLTISCALFFCDSVANAGTGEQMTTLADQKSVAVTIYNNDLALVKDLRQVNLVSSDFGLAWRDVSAQIRPETALLRSVSHPGGIAVVEQNFNFDLLTPQSLLSKYIGQAVTIIKINPATGAESKEDAVVLAASEGVVLKMADRIETGIPGRIVFENVPNNLRDRPTLVIKGNRSDPAIQELELSYLTSGLSWKADYVAELNDADDQMDLSGWVTLTNTSGTHYSQAKLQLVAGDINRVQQELAVPMAMRGKAAFDTAELSMNQESLMEYHLYHLNRPTTLAENQTKQVALLNAVSVPVRKELVLTGNDYYYASNHGDLGQKLKVSVFVQFDNKESVRLGMPLPKGTMRVYKRDKTGNAQFVGEDWIDHTPINETVRLKLGQSFDVTAARKQTDFKQLSTGNNNTAINRFESAYEITLKNAKKEAVTVLVQEPIPGDWKIIEESQPHSKPVSNLAVWTVEVPAEGSALLKYRVQIRY